MAADVLSVGLFQFDSYTWRCANLTCGDGGGGGGLWIQVSKW